MSEKKMQKEELEKVAGGKRDLTEMLKREAENSHELCVCQFCGKTFRERSLDDIERNPLASVPGRYWLTHTCRDCELNEAWVHRKTTE